MKKILFLIIFLFMSVGAEAESVRDRLQRAREKDRVRSQETKSMGTSQDSGSVVVRQGFKVMDGLETETYPDGSPSMIANYKNGRLEGVAKFYYEDGSLKEVAHYHNDRLEGVVRKYDERGNQTLEEHYVTGKLEGARKEFFAGGKLRLEEEYRNGVLEGPQTAYHSNGKVRTQSNFVKGAVDGLVVENFPSGSKSVESFIKDGKKQWEKTYIYNEGRGAVPYNDLIYIREHAFGPTGQLIKTRHYDASGKVIFSQDSPATTPNKQK